MLTRTLRHLERDGYIIRTVESDRPVRVSYRLSEIGNSAIAAAQMFVDWATSQHTAIRESRKVYDAKFGQ